jgi:hypothetical protein
MGFLTAFGVLALGAAGVCSAAPPGQSCILEGLNEAVSSARLDARANPPSAAPAGVAELIPLFDGHTLEGWIQEGPRATFSAGGGELRTSGRGNRPNWLRTVREYEDFRLQFEYKLAQWAEAAVYLRAPRSAYPGEAGLAIVLAHDFHSRRDTEHVTGAVRGVLKPAKSLPPSFNEWHSVDVTLDGDLLVVAIDGVEVQNTRLGAHPELRYRLRKGYIGFPDLGHAYALRNLRIEERGGRTRFRELFDGQSLAGWKLYGGGNWIVRNGAIEASNGHGWLFADGEFQDFELTLLVRTHHHPNGGVRVRSAPKSGARGFEVQIYSPPEAVYPTGSIYGMVRSRITRDHEGEWILMQILLQGSRCLVRIDGQTVAETDRLPDSALKAGQIGLQIHQEDCSIEYRDIRLREL